jgi:hypothetical protein
MPSLHSTTKRINFTARPEVLYPGLFPVDSCCDLCSAPFPGCCAFTMDISGCALKGGAARKTPSTVIIFGDQPGSAPYQSHSSTGPRSIGRNANTVAHGTNRVNLAPIARVRGPARNTRSGTSV